MSRLYDHECRRCSLFDGVKTVCVPASGKNNIGGMIVGEAPGRMEDQMGQPFIGSAGLALNSALSKAGVMRRDIIVTNAVKCRPPNNRTPYVTEISRCSYYLEKELKRWKPKAILACGNAACDALLGVAGISDLRGTWRTTYLTEVEYSVLPTWHPAALLYDPAKKITFEQDIREFIEALA